jgi:hypothetical protein
MNLASCVSHNAQANSLVAADVGSYVTLEVTATNAGGSTTPTSEEVRPIEEATR